MVAEGQLPKGVVVAGTHSGCGKTTVSLALMAAFARRGLSVQPFKAGPDFIDPSLHAAATGRPSHNLDGWMLGRDRCRELFCRHARNSELAVVEGVMGLYDGASGTDETGSTAEMAKWLGLPVLLVVDARSMARSAAAMVQGYAGFDADLQVGGVIFNRVGSERHRELLWEAMAANCPNVPVVGFLPREEGLELPQRHLGLHTAQDGVLTSERLHSLASWVEQNLDLQRLHATLPEARLAGEPAGAGTLQSAPACRARIGVAHDRAFSFYYPENFRILEAGGAELVFFSPLHDAHLPQGLDGLYIGGGYPELHARQLADNASMRRAVRDFGLSGKPVYGECGGFMYLMEELHSDEGAFLMAGLFAMHSRMEPRLRSLGYREVVTRSPSCFGPAWTMFRGHEFHYSRIVQDDADAAPLYKVMDRRGWLPHPEGSMRGSVLGSYIHVHFGSNPEAAAAFVAACAGQSPGEQHES